jgi:hypothetical protein
MYSRGKEFQKLLKERKGTLKEQEQEHILQDLAAKENTFNDFNLEKRTEEAGTSEEMLGMGPSRIVMIAKLSLEELDERQKKL